MTSDNGNTEAGKPVGTAAGEGGAAAAPGPLRRWIWNDTIQTIFYAILIALFVRIVAFQPFNIPSSSMYPTLLIGDYLFVSKYSYGYSRYSFPFGLVPFKGRIWESPVERGDVAVFRNPQDLSQDYIKRIVGLPGDRIQVKNGILHINGEPVRRQRIEDYELRPGRLVPQYLETLPNGRVHRIVEEKGDSGYSDTTREFVVPEGHYFAMGDNRDNSADSRAIGYIPAENLIGRAEILFFSLNVGRNRDPDSFFIRFGRIFDGIE
ncbi:MAG: signal peptidase I [Rhodospirillales bacterium]|nr:MAG: signal peptidase I [Rhodospirillales bacterium]